MSDMNDEPIVCPKCNSDNVAKSRKPSSIVGILLLLFGIPFLSYRKEFHCFDCYTDFKIESPTTKSL